MAKLLPYIVVAAFMVSPAITASTWAQHGSGWTVIKSPASDTIERAYSAGTAWISAATKDEPANVSIKKMCVGREPDGGWRTSISYDCRVVSCGWPKRDASEELSKKPSLNPPPHVMHAPPGRVDMTTTLTSQIWKTMEPAYKAGKAWIDDPSKHGSISMRRLCIDQNSNGGWQASIDYFY